MSRRALSPECRIVFRSADPDWTAAADDALVQAVTDWPRLMRIAEHEAAVIAVWRALRPQESRIPGEVATHLRQASMLHEFRIQRLAQRARETTRVLAERGVPFLLLKGAAIGALYDASFRSRPMNDLDLLVRREDTARASDAVIAAGWPMTTDPRLLELLKDAHHLPHFVDPHIHDIRLELHVALMPDDHSFALSESDLWRAAIPAPPPFTGALVPSREHIVLHAAVHFAWQHTMAFGAWRTFRMIAMLLREPGFDWEGFVRQAIDAKAATCCYWTLRLAAHLADLEVPADVLARLAPPTPAWLCAAIERHFVAMLAPGESAPSPSQQLTRLLWRAALRPRWSGHRAPGRHDPEQRWARAYGLVSDETFAQRLARHLASLQTWRRFFSDTLSG